ERVIGSGYKERNLTRPNGLGLGFLFASFRYLMIMDQYPQTTVIRNPLSTSLRTQECVSYIREDDSIHPAESYYRKQVRSPPPPLPSHYTNVPSRPHNLSLQVETPDEVFTETRNHNYTYEGNIAYVKPMARQIITSPIEGPMKYSNGQDEFLIFGTSRRLRSEFYDEKSKEEELELREQKIAEREAELQRQIEEEGRRRLERLRELEKTVYIDEGADEYDEEIIEDIITTRRKPSVLSPSACLSPETSKIMTSVGVGDADVNQYFLLDTGSRSVNPADFPPVYWERLSRYFTEEIKRRRPSCRDVAAQLTPVKQRTVSQSAYGKEAKGLRNFGVCVKPITSTRGFTTDAATSPNKRNSACMTDDLDEYFARLLRSICADYPNADRTFITNLYRYSRTDISMFIHRLFERLEELRNVEKQVVVTKPRMCSVGLDVRPVMLDKRTLSEPPVRRNLGTNTEQVLCRTQGISTPRPTSPATSDFGGTTDLIRRMETGSQTKLVEPMEAPSSLSKAGGMVEAETRKVTTYRIKRVSGHVDKEGKVSAKTFETSGEGKPPHSALLESIRDVIKDTKKREDGRPSRHRPNSESNSHYYTGTTLTETWFDKDTPSKSQMSPLSGHVSPRVQVSPTHSAEHVPGGYSRTVEVARSPSFATHEEAEGVSTLQYQQFRRTPVQRTKSPSLGGPHTYRSDSPNIPLRNYTYKVTAEMRKAVEALSSFYMTSPGGTLTDDLQGHLEVVRKAWFDMVSKTNIDIEQVEDLFAFLYNSAPQLLHLFIRMPTTRGSTCLHYAVGHGAWRVVSLILNTGYADANKKNAFGFSPIMIAAISDSIDSSAVPVLERLFAAGDVNARAGTAPGQTPLMLAARKANTTVVELLLRHGADVNTQDDIGNTALMCAIDCGNLEMVKLLIARPEINLDLKDQEGSTAISIAEAGGNEDIIRLIREKASIYKADLTHRVTGSGLQLFEPRTFQIVPEEETITTTEAAGRSGISTRTTTTTTKITTRHYTVQGESDT
ncbi:unnamed protein product, partial [Hymenolepis diminuta]